MITLLPTLRCFHLLSNHFDHLSSLLYNLWSKHYTFTGLIPTKRCSTFSTIQRFKRHHSNTRIIIVVIGELYQRQMTVPNTSLLEKTSSQQVFQRLNSPLSLSIHLRMISRTQLEIRTQCFMQTLPKPESKPHISIRYYARQNSIQLHNHIDIQIYQLLQRITDINQYKIIQQRTIRMHPSPNKQNRVNLFICV